MYVLDTNVFIDVQTRTMRLIWPPDTGTSSFSYSTLTTP